MGGRINDGFEILKYRRCRDTLRLSLSLSQFHLRIQVRDIKYIRFNIPINIHSANRYPSSKPPP